MRVYFYFYIYLFEKLLMDEEGLRIDICCGIIVYIMLPENYVMVQDMGFRYYGWKAVLYAVDI